MRYYGNDPYTPGTLDNDKPIEHGTIKDEYKYISPEPAKRVNNSDIFVRSGKKVMQLKTGKVYPSVTAAANAAHVKQPTMSVWLKKENRGWVFVTGIMEA